MEVIISPNATVSALAKAVIAEFRLGLPANSVDLLLEVDARDSVPLDTCLKVSEQGLKHGAKLILVVSPPVPPVRISYRLKLGRGKSPPIDDHFSTNVKLEAFLLVHNLYCMRYSKGGDVIVRAVHDLQSAVCMDGEYLLLSEASRIFGENLSEFKKNNYNSAIAVEIRSNEGIFFDEELSKACDGKLSPVNGFNAACTP